MHVHQEQKKQSILSRVQEKRENVLPGSPSGTGGDQGVKAARLAVAGGPSAGPRAPEGAGSAPRGPRLPVGCSPSRIGDRSLIRAKKEGREHLLFLSLMPEIQGPKMEHVCKSL